MSLASYPPMAGPQSPTARAAAEAFWNVLNWMAGLHIFAASFPESNYHITPFGCRFDRDFACTLWTTLRLLTRDITVSPDIIQFALTHGLRQPPPIFRFPFITEINILDILFPSYAEARDFVHLVQKTGREALEWVVQLCQVMERESVRAGASLPPTHQGFLTYYRTLTWRDDNDAPNPCRAMVPYQPPPPSGPSESPMVCSGGAGAYSPLQPFVLPSPNTPLPVAGPSMSSSAVSSPVAPGPAAAPDTSADLCRLFRTLLGQEGAGLPGLHRLQGLDHTATVQELLKQLAAPDPNAMNVTTTSDAPEITELN